MTFQQLRRDIQELKSSIVSGTQPQFKIFEFKIGGFETTEGLTAADVDEYENTHPYTKVMRFRRADFRKKVSE
jgi:hypothetical protein